MNLWYTTLVKPPLTPPGEYFPIAWGILYTFMVIAFLFVLSKKQSKEKYIAVNLFVIQLIINFTWSYVFFELKSIELALIDVLVLLILLGFTVVYFFKVSKTAGFLMFPYLLQVVFALYLNAGIAVLN